MVVRLRGSTWGHPRGYAPLEAGTIAYRSIVPDLDVMWDVRGLQEFGTFSVVELARTYDLLILDHPLLGEAVEAEALVPLEDHIPARHLQVYESESVGQSFASYLLDGKTWALPVDAAAQVSIFRPDLLAIEDVPTVWSDVIRLARSHRVLWPLKPSDAICSFMTLAANSDAPVVDGKGDFMARDLAVAILKNMQELVDHLPPECLDWNPIDALSLLSSDQDQYAYIPLAFGYSNYSRTGFADHVLRAADIPGASESHPCGAVLGGAGIAVSAHCAHPREAAGYAAWIASSEIQSTLYLDAGGQPAAASAWESARSNALTHDFFNSTRRTLEASWLRPRWAGFSEWQDRAGALVNAFLSGSTGIIETVSALEESYVLAREGARAAKEGGRFSD